MGAIIPLIIRSQAIITTLLSYVEVFASFVFVLGVLVFVHELGHFLVAKKCGMKVEEFSLGYPPKAFGIKWGETEYLISWLPLGGYVKVAGMSDFGRAEAEGKSWEFLQRPRWMQAAVFVAGPLMNVILGYLLILTVQVTYGEYAYLSQSVLGGVHQKSALYEAGVRPGDRILKINDQDVSDWADLFRGVSTSLGERADFVVDRDGDVFTATALMPTDLAELRVSPDYEPLVGPISPGYPAEAAGLQMGDRITAVDGKPVERWWQMSELISARPDMPVQIDWVRRGDDGPVPMSTMITPKADDDDGETVGRIGIGVSQDQARVPVMFGKAVTSSGRQLVGSATAIFGFLKRIVSGRSSGNELAGPVQIAQLAGQYAKEGFESLFGFMALLSINLAVLNLLPIPMLDGGHLFIMAIETVARREFSVKQKEVLQQVGFVFLLALMIYVTANDIGRWWAN